MEAAWSSLEEYFALNASIERVFRDYRGRFNSGTVRIITVELVAGLTHPLEIKTKIATALDMKGSLEGASGFRVLGRSRSGGGLGDC